MFAVVLLNCSCSVDCYVVFHVLYTLSLSGCFLFGGGTWSSLFVLFCVLCCSMLVLGGGVFFCCYLLFDVYFMCFIFVVASVVCSFCVFVVLCWCWIWVARLSYLLFSFVFLIRIWLRAGHVCCFSFEL